MTTEPNELRARLEQHATDELLAILRERNEDEWRPEVFGIVASILADRGVSVSEMAVSTNESETDDQPALVTIASFPSPGEAEVARMTLEGAGLGAWVVGSTAGPLDNSRLQVRTQDEQAAREVLESVPASSGDLPPEIAEPPCRRCGANSVRPVHELLESGSPHYNGTDGRPAPRWLYVCDACGDTWPDESDSTDRSEEGVVISGADVGFRLDPGQSSSGLRTGQLMVRINGRWVEASIAANSKAAPTK
jgi:hypothetical protein